MNPSVAARTSNSTQPRAVAQPSSGAARVVPPFFGVRTAAISLLVDRVLGA